ncbi:MAG: methylenetetrahydrofolate reductase [NAD(P)H] [Candidatus Sumerlaeaceae bacterium]
MRLNQIYASYSPAVSVEFFPPRTAEGEADLAIRIPEIKALRPAFCSVTYGAGGSGRDRTLGWVHRIKHDFGMEVMCHLTCVGQSRAETDEVLKKLKADGVENLIALRGDPPKGEAAWRPHPEGYHYAAQLVKACRDKGFSVAVAGFPEFHPEAQSSESDLRFLKEKVDAGADAVITQLFFDNQDFFRYVDSARSLGVKVPIVPGILPFRTVEEIRRFTTKYALTMTGPARVPPELEKQLAPVENDDSAAAKLGIEWATRQCRELLDAGAPGIHFYCMNKSNVVETIMRNLNLAAT